MRKLLVVLLVVLGLGGLMTVAVGCGDEESAATESVTTTVSDNTDDTIAELADAWTTEEAADHIGETGAVTGTVVGIEDMGESIAAYLIRLDSGDNGVGANAVISYVNIANFIDSGFGQDLIGRTVRVTGEIYESESEAKPEIELTVGDQLAIVE